MVDELTAPTPRPEPLFSLDLGDNGARLSPTSYSDLSRWIQVEQSFWSSILNRQYGNHEQGLREAIGGLNQAQNAASEAQRHLANNAQLAQQQLERSRSQIEDVYVRRKLPHSSVPLAKRVEAYRSEAGEQAASYFSSVFVPPAQGHHFEPKDLSAWRGLADGLIERFLPLASAPKGRKQAAEQSFEQLRAKADQLVAEKSETYDALHRDYSGLAESLRATADAHVTVFDTAQTKRQEDFDQLVEKHEQAMDGLRRAFREEISLRAPAEYWETKRRGHRTMAWVTGAMSFLSIAAVACVLGWQTRELLQATPANSTPQTWRLAVLALIGLFGVWGARLLVRMFLSHLHLLTDAGERVVMVKTYLSLQEGDRLASKEDRQLILQALFRPASDGIVKDEGIPASFVELLSRQGRS